MNNHVAVTSAADFQREVIDFAGPVLVDFWAPWCKPCLIQNPVLEQLSNEQSELKIVKVDVDQVPDLASREQIFAIPTMMFMSAKDDAGARNSIRQSGFLPMHELLKWMGGGGFVPAAKAAASSTGTDLPLAA